MIVTLNSATEHNPNASGKPIHSENRKAKAIRFSTLESICKALDCQPGDLLEYTDDEK